MLKATYTFFLFLLLFYTLQASAQQIKVIGKVLQPDKQTPVAGAGVLVLKSRVATVTDIAGQFKLYAQQGDSLLVRAVGFKPLYYNIKQQPATELRLTIILQEDSVLLQEVQVNSMPSEDQIRKALRNMPEKPKMLVQRPGYIPGLEPPPPPPPPPPTILWNPVSYFSKEGKQKRKLKKLQSTEAAYHRQLELNRLKAAQEEAERQYNSFFKDSTSYR
ncbi:carboxypeptidase-like regulatory domain-containing protein [Pontibacter sp. H249]|uniref:carboxypeptidase-like regulatory domain-containing protein n=1 Tax=Pontibacter sp. H249 TaxID=3133420 RepID=UPI0030BFBBC1